MKIFDEDPLDIPPVRVTPLEKDDKGRSLLDRMEALQNQKEKARSEAREAGRPLADLLAEADELAALALVGDVDPEEADAAEEEARSRRERIEEARRQVKQCERAASLVRKKIDERAIELYEENGEAVRSVHRVLVQEALEAERRAALLLRVLREFETHYARYTAGSDPEPHPQYLNEHERTSPPRPLMGPARTPGGNVFNSSEATLWMQRAATLLDADPPAVVEVASLDFESDDATPSTSRLDWRADEHSNAMASDGSGSPADASSRTDADASEAENASDAMSDKSEAGSESSHERAPASEVGAAMSDEAEGEDAEGEEATADVDDDSETDETS